MKLLNIMYDVVLNENSPVNEIKKQYSMDTIGNVRGDLEFDIWNKVYFEVCLKVESSTYLI